jgi:CubicO group peptidase (beta-lactamase class C family)
MRSAGAILTRLTPATKAKHHPRDTPRSSAGPAGPGPFTPGPVSPSPAGYEPPQGYDIVQHDAIEPLLAVPPHPAALRGWEAFTRLLDERAPADQVVGAAAILMRGGEIVARHHYGLADRERRVPVTERTIFHYASITKVLTAIAIMQLRDRGRLTLEDPVTRYLPELRRLHDPFGAIDRITLRLLLSHSAGFQNPTWPYTDGKVWQPFEPTSWEQLVALLPYQELHFEPGTRYGYSNPAFIYLGRIVEQLTGDPWGVYIQKNIFAPLGMTHSYFGATPYHLAGDRSHSYTRHWEGAGSAAGAAEGTPGAAAVVRGGATSPDAVLHDHGPDFDTGITTPNGGWNAPLDDLATLLAFLAGATRGDPERERLNDTVLARSTLREMWRPLHPTGVATPAGREAMGLSFYVIEGPDESGRDGRRAGGHDQTRQSERTTLVGHAGFQAGFLAFFYLNPATATAIAVAFNTNDAAQPEGRSPAYQAVHDAALGVIG